MEVIGKQARKELQIWGCRGNVEMGLSIYTKCHTTSISRTGLIGLTFDLTHSHLDAAFATLAHIILRVVIREDPVLEHKVPWLPT